MGRELELLFAFGRICGSAPSRWAARGIGRERKPTLPKRIGMELLSGLQPREDLAGLRTTRQRSFVGLSHKLLAPHSVCVLHDGADQVVVEQHARVPKFISGTALQGITGLARQGGGAVALEAGCSSHTGKARQ